MDGIKRNLLYWSYTIGQALLMIVVMVLVLCFMMLDETGNILLAFCVTMSKYGAAYMPFFMGILGMTVISLNMPLTLSMGSTRKDSFIGMEMILHLEGLILTGIIIAADIFSGKTANSILFWGSAMRLAASAALCNFVGWTYLRFGKVISLIAYVVLVIAGGIGVSVCSVLYEEGRFVLPGGWGAPLVAAALAAADCIGIWLYDREAKKIEVRV